MKSLFIAALGAFGATAVAAEVTVSVANGTDQVFDSVTVSAVDASGAVLDQDLGRHDSTLRPGQSATILLQLDGCAPVFLQAWRGADALATAEADACDPAIYTLTE